MSALNHDNPFAVDLLEHPHAISLATAMEFLHPEVPPGHLQCPECGSVFRKRMGTASGCSPACRTKAAMGRVYGVGTRLHA
jgi:hypothetical protein